MNEQRKIFSQKDYDRSTFIEKPEDGYECKFITEAGHEFRYCLLQREYPSREQAYAEFNGTIEQYNYELEALGKSYSYPFRTP
tara:strand:+ start:279 stop:527 length:249 start_codon:yes stop_codon:yes gene_type:complete